VGYSKDSSKKEVIAMSAYLKKLKTFQINNIMIYPKILEKQE
jgi:hypothetical protein